MPTGPFIQVEAKGISVALAGQELSGDFTFVRSTNTENNETITRVSVKNVLVSISAGGRELVRATSTVGMESFLEIRPETLVGVLNVNTIIDVPGVKLSGSFGVYFNSGAEDQDFDHDNNSATPLQTIKKGITVKGEQVTLDVMGQRLTGDFTFEKQANKTVLAATDLQLVMGNGSQDLVFVKVATGAILIKNDGIAASMSGSVQLAPELNELSFDSSIKILINTTKSDVDEIINVSGTDVSLKVSKGDPTPYVRVEAGESGNPAKLVIAGQTLETVFVFEQAQSLSGTKVIRLSLSETTPFPW